MVLVLVFPALAQDAAPKKILFQARLSNSSGPITGSVRIGFRIFDSLTGGTRLLWQSYSTEPPEVFIRDGYYEKILEVPFSVFTIPDTYLEIVYWIGGWSEAALTPRLKFHSAPYSLNTYYLNNLEPKVSGADEHIVKTDGGGRAAFGSAAIDTGYGLSARGTYAGGSANSTSNFSLIGENASGVNEYLRYGIYAATTSLSLPAIKADNTADGSALMIYGGSLSIDHDVYFTPPHRVITDPEGEEFWISFYLKHTGPIGVVEIPYTWGQFRVNNDLVTDNSIILLTPVYGANFEPYISDRGEGYFVVYKGAYPYSGFVTVQFMIIN